MENSEFSGSLDQQIPNKQADRKFSSLKPTKLLIVIFISLLVISVILFYLYRNYLQYISNFNFGTTQITISDSDNPTTPEESSITTEPTDYDNNSEWQIIDASKSPAWPTGVSLRGLGSSRSDVSRWNKYLIGLDHLEYLDKPAIQFIHDDVSRAYNTYHAIIAVNLYNVETGQIIKVPLNEPSINNWGESAQVVIDNTLYFGSGGKFGPNLEYKLELPVTNNSVAQKIPVSLGSDLAKYGNSYISPSCYEGCTYYLFDPNNLTKTILPRLNAADNGYVEDRPERFIGFDSKGNYILQKFDENLSQTVEIIAVPLSNEKTETTLLSKEQLPVSNFTMYLADGQDRALLIGNDGAYTLNLRTSEVSAANVSNEVLQKDYVNIDTMIRGNNHVVCATYHLGDNKGSVEQIAFDFDTNSFDEELSDQCEERWKIFSPEERFEQLELPDNFVLTHI